MERLSPQDSVEKVLAEYASFRNCFENPPQVSLELLSQTPPEHQDVNSRDIVATTAAQCYAKGIAKMKPRPEMEKTVDDTLQSGHHTTRQHTNYTWLLAGVSRSVTHDVFHANPYYNSEQQSQRYVEAREGFYLIPSGLTERQRDIFVEAADFSNKQYFHFLDALKGDITKRVEEMYPKNWQENARSRLDSKIQKCCQEIARYVLPIGQLTNFYHTLSELQLLRLFRASKMSQYSKEAKYIIGQMVEEVAKVDPSILKELRKPAEKEDPVYLESYITEEKEGFDQLLEGKSSTLVTINLEAGRFLAKIVRHIRGIPESAASDEEILDLLLNPAKNSFLYDTYEEGIMDPTTSCLRGVAVIFITKLSHTADSQRQRHRRTYGITPPIEATYDGMPDFISPLAIRENDDLEANYSQTMANIYDNVRRAIESGIPKEQALLLLPNAHALRLMETGDFLDWFHRFKQRLCFCAQEEIFFISVEQAEQIIELFEEAKQILLAPCSIRQQAGARPRCTEGNRWCGQQVFNFSGIKEYKEKRLI